MKGTFSVSPTFTSLYIQKPHVILIDPLVVWDTKRLYFRSHLISIPWESKPIINCTYSKIYDLLFLLCEDWKLYVFTQNLQLLTKFIWDSKYTVCFRLLQQINSFLMIGVSQVQLLKMKLVSNVKQTKFLSSMKCEIIKSQTLIADQKTKLKWHKGYDISLPDNMLYVWSLQDIIFYKLSNLEVISKIEGITKKEIPLTKVYYNQFYKYILIGYMNGQIKIWKFPKNYQKREIIHTFSYHNKQIVSMIKTNDHRIFISQSSDLKICFGNLDTFELMYTYDFLGQYQQIFLKNTERFYVIKDIQLGQCEFGKKMQFICQINNDINTIDKFYNNTSLFNHKTSTDQLKSIQFTLNSNLGFRIITDDLNMPDVNKTNIQYFYPPLKSKGITQIISCPFDPTQFYLLVENGQIYNTRMQNNSGKIQNLYVIQKIVDDEAHQLNETASVIKFLKILPPKYDSEIISKIINKDAQLNSKMNEADLQNKFMQLQLITIGCSKGAIVFLSRKNFQKIYTRITYHRQQIINLDCINNQQTKESFLISMCSERLFKIIKFDGDKSICLKTIHCENWLRNFQIGMNKLFCIFPKGMFQIFKISKQGVLNAIQNDQANDHQENIICIDVNESKKVVVTGAQDKKIKIWNFYKFLIYQINITEQINYVCFANDLDLIISHNKKISLLRKNNFKISDKEMETWQQEFLSRNQHQHTQLEKYITKLKEKAKMEQSIGKKRLKNSEIKKRHQTEQIKQDVINQNLKQKGSKSFIVTKSKNKKSKNQSTEQYEEQKKQTLIQEQFKQNMISLNKHLNDINNIKKENLTHLPRLHQQKQTLFDQFMKTKLLNKKILTRRDITLNRIIMKNIIREYVGGDMNEGLPPVKTNPS